MECKHPIKILIVYRIKDWKSLVEYRLAKGIIECSWKPIILWYANGWTQGIK